MIHVLLLHLSPADPMFLIRRTLIQKRYIFHLMLVSMFVCVGSHVLDLENYNPKMLHLSPATSVWVVTSFTCHFSIGWVPCFGLRKFLPENVTSFTCHFSMIQVLWFGLKYMCWVPCFSDLESFNQKLYIIHLLLQYGLLHLSPTT